MNVTATKPTAVPVEIYKELYDYLNEGQFDTDDFEDESSVSKEFVFESKDGHWLITGEAEASSQYIDESFDHAFGTEYCGYWDMDELEDVTVYGCSHFDEDDNETKADFDFGVFDHLHDQATITRGGVTIHAGDDVVVKDYFYSRWMLAKFRYYDPVKKRYFFTDAGTPFPYGYKLLPATEENLKKVGTY